MGCTQEFRIGLEAPQYEKLAISFEFIITIFDEPSAPKIFRFHPNLNPICDFYCSADQKYD